MLPKMFVSNNNNFVSSPQQSSMRAPSTPMSPSGFSPISPEIQCRINECQPTRELMQRQETINMLRGNSLILICDCNWVCKSNLTNLNFMASALILKFGKVFKF